ncbi:MAG: hypothetical protein V1754_06875 [Pseudomonadota bacterium]
MRLFKSSLSYAKPGLPADCRILPADIDFWVPGFEQSTRSRTLALRERNCAEWFDAFVDKLLEATGKRYLPVCRMSDGEFRFCLGDQPVSKRWPWHDRMRISVGQNLRKIRDRRGFRAATTSGVSSGQYSATEWKQMRKCYTDLVRILSEKGILALHLSYGDMPFQEHFFPALGKWLKDNGIGLSEENYVPFYFVYGAFMGLRRSELLRGKKILLVNSANQSKQKRIETSLKEEGIDRVFWCPVSASRSFFDKLEVQQFIGEVDLVLVGAGVGKPNVLVQLEPLCVPCVDVGFLFEVWANPQNKFLRACCVTDAESNKY